jgi:hypothetical protein
MPQLDEPGSGSFRNAGPAERRFPRVFFAREVLRCLDGTEYLERLTKWALQLPVADEAAGEVEEGLVDVGAAFVADAEAPVLV